MKIMDIYDFVIENKCEVHCYGYDYSKEPQILIFIDSLHIGDFTHMLDNDFYGCLDDGGLKAHIVHGGNLCVDIMPVIEYVCDTDKIDKIIELFERHCSK